MSKPTPTPIERIAQLFTQYWVRDNGQESLDALARTKLAKLGGLGGREQAQANALMAEAFIDVVGVDLDVRDSEHQQVWAQAWERVRDILVVQARLMNPDGTIRGVCYCAPSTNRGAVLQASIRRGTAGGFTTSFMVDGHDFRKVYAKLVLAIAEHYKLPDDSPLRSEMQSSADLFLKKNGLRLVEVVEVRYEQVVRDDPAQTPDPEHVRHVDSGPAP